LWSSASPGGDAGGAGTPHVSNRKVNRRRFARHCPTTASSLALSCKRCWRASTAPPRTAFAAEPLVSSQDLQDSHDVRAPIGTTPFPLRSVVTAHDWIMDSWSCPRLAASRCAGPDPSRAPPPKTVTISREGAGWYVSFSCASAHATSAHATSATDGSRDRR